MYKRHLSSKIAKAMTFAPIILITGPRQAGKTTLTKLVGGQDFFYTSFDQVAVYSNAANDPVGFVNALPKPVIIDEVQRVPEIFLPIKVDIDNNRHAGRYMLTGSANPLLLPKLGDALTGRMNPYQLWPLSQGEIEGRREDFLDLVFAEDFGKIRTLECSKESLLQRAALGGFPPMLAAKSHEERVDWCTSYISLALQKDVLDLARIEGIAQLPNLLRILANGIGSIQNHTSISNSTEIAFTTLRRYLSLLHSLYLIFSVPAWSKNQTQRLIKSPKIYFIDTAILLSAMGMTLQKAPLPPQATGAVLENFVASELSKQISWHTERISLYHFRTAHQAEVDFILENEAGQVVGIEVKSTETVTLSDFRHFGQLKLSAGNKFLRGIVLYSGNTVLPFGDGLWAVPMSAMWTNA